ncbi:hypothetical protein Dimus_037024 [Dionaea muscipula]
MPFIYSSRITYSSSVVHCLRLLDHHHRLRSQVHPLETSVTAANVNYKSTSYLKTSSTNGRILVRLIPSRLETNKDLPVLLHFGQNGDLSGLRYDEQNEDLACKGFMKCLSR